MCLSIMGVIIESSFLIGFCLSSLSVGGSVAKAKAPKESIMRFIQSIYTAEKIGWFIATADISVVITATILTVTWN